ncbi:hypothetical protein EC991_006217 [Linnemannia zychae]|nr:hypothetical protein EC991_006217 [Linnemannia zychae]
MLKSILAIIQTQGAELKEAEKELQLLKSQLAANTANQRSLEFDKGEGLTPYHSGGNIALHHFLTEANNRHYYGLKFDSKTVGAEYAFEWADYFRGYLINNTFDIPVELRDIVGMRMLTESIKGLQRCKQKEYEDTVIYIIRFERAVARYLRARTSPMDEMSVMQALYAGLMSKDVADAVKKSKNYSSAIAAAKAAAEEELQWVYIRSKSPDR